MTNDDVAPSELEDSSADASRRSEEIKIGDQSIFIHVTPKCEHEFAGWRTFEDGNGGEQVCTKCGIGAMSASLREDF